MTARRKGPRPKKGPYYLHQTLTDHVSDQNKHSDMLADVTSCYGTFLDFIAFLFKKNSFKKHI